MGYLDFERLEALDPRRFRRATPYPWLNFEGALAEKGYDELRESLPDVSLLEPVFGKVRKHGQRSHDRFALEYREGLPLSGPWRAFIAELQGERYQRWLRTMIGARWLRLHYHWHYTPTGCSVSPHCDAPWKLGSHIFYLNTEEDWDPAWGGQTEVLDDGGRFPRRSAPDWGDFDRAIESDSLGNRSLLFTRKGNSWHGVREIRCPEGLYRKVFIVVINRDGPLERLRRLWPGAKRPGY